MANTFIKYVKLWLTFAKYELQNQFSTKLSAIFFFIGKAFRFLSFFVILLLLKNNAQNIAGYSIDQALIFFITFNLIDTISQMFLRGVYSLAGKVRNGEFDFFLIRPMSPLFRSLAGAPDFNDLLLLFPLIGFSIWYIVSSVPNLSIHGVLLYLLLFANGLLIATSFHIFVLCVGVVSTEVDNAIMLYRDIAQMGRFPMEIYRQPLQAVATFIIPVGMMISIPAKVLLGLSTPTLMFTACAIGISAFSLSLLAWKQALKMYTSASS